MGVRHLALLAVRDPLLRSQLEHALQRAGFDVALASSADTALQRARASTPQLAVAEEALDGGAGGALLAAIRKLPASAPPFTLALLEPGAASVLADADADLMSKPIDFDRFQRRVRVVARGLQATHALGAEREANARDAEALALAHRAAGLGVWECDPVSGEVALTDAAQKLLGLSGAPSSLDALFSRCVHPEDRAKVSDALRSAQPGGSFEHRVAGTQRVVRHVVARAAGGAASELPLRLLAQDLTQSRLAEARLRRTQLFDPVTELPTRTLFFSRLERALRSLEGTKRSVAVLAIELVGLPPASELPGASDELLRVLAERLLLAVRPSDAVGHANVQHGAARTGAVRFAVALTGIARTEDAAACARRVAEALSAPIPLPGTSRTISVGAHVNVSLSPRDGTSAEALMGPAEDPAARGELHGLAHASADADQRSATILADLPRVAERGELTLLYQPRVDLPGLRLAGAEALIRWRHPQLGEISPKEFIGIAEREGLIDAIGAWAVSHAASYAATWAAAASVSVNVSRSQLLAGDFAQNVFRSLIAAGLPPARLELEVTESMMYESERCLDALRELSAVGVTLALDDFGTGYSSLSALVRLPVQVIKIDRSLVREIDENPAALRVIRGIARVGHDLGMRVVAEGVDREAQVPLLCEAECDEAQGFLFAKPLAESDFDAFAAKRGRAPGGGVALGRLRRG